MKTVWRKKEGLVLSVVKESTKSAVNCLVSNWVSNTLFDRFSYAGFSIIRMNKIIFCKESDGVIQSTGFVSRIRDG